MSTVSGRRVDHADAKPRAARASLTRGRASQTVVAAHNAEIADRLNRYATLLEIDGANPFRIRAYRNAARTIENFSHDVGLYLAEGGDLDDLPGIGKDLAGKIAEIATTGHFHELENIEGRLPPALVELTHIPGL